MSTGAATLQVTDTTPSGCRWCGIPERHHAQRWTEAAGWHGWTAPTQQQIKDRMLARRETARLRRRRT